MKPIVEVEPNSFCPFAPPVEIEGFGFISFAGLDDMKGTSEQTWRYYPTKAERQTQGLRIELYRRADGTGEARLVKGPYSAPKHLQVTRLRRFTPLPIRAAVAELRVLYFQKGW